MISEHQLLAQKGAQLVEYRLDWLGTEPDLSRLLKDRPTPVVVTCRRAQDKGLWRFPEETRQRLLRSAIVMGVEYVDLEDDIAASIPRFGKTKRIVSYHNFDETPADLAAIHKRLAALDPDVIKIVTLAKTPLDSVRILQMVASSKIPTVGFCMGDLGVWSRVLCAKYGSPFTYATFSSERTMAPGQLTYEETRDVYHFDRINRDTQVFGVVADPVSHSLSPLIQNAAFQALGMNCVYLPFRVPREQLASTIEEFDWLNVRGYSVTLPHKVAALEIADSFQGPIERIGAINTLVAQDKEGSKSWIGANTDCDAALASLRLAYDRAGDPDRPAQDPLSGKRVLILGAGGVARAIAAGLIGVGAAVTITNRTKSKSTELAKELGCLVAGWENRGAQGCDILINCTSVGMHPKVDETPFMAHWLTENTLVFDTVYTPERTMLIAHARERGCRTVTGVEMFVRQAARQFQLFTGESAPTDVMRDTLKRKLSVVKVNP